MVFLPHLCCSMKKALRFLIPSVEALFLRDLVTQTDGLTVTQLHASRMLRAIWPSLRRMCCFHSELSEKSSSIRRGRLFPTRFRRASNHHSPERKVAQAHHEGLVNCCC